MIRLARFTLGFPFWVVGYLLWLISAVFISWANVLHGRPKKKRLKLRPKTR
jgi:hypothetical protein